MKIKSRNIKVEVTTGNGQEWSVGDDVGFDFVGTDMKKRSCVGIIKALEEYSVVLTNVYINDKQYDGLLVVAYQDIVASSVGYVYYD